MKKRYHFPVIFALMMLVFTIPCYCVYADSRLELGFDAGCVQDFLLKTDSFQMSANIGYSLNDKFELRLPFTVSMAPESQFFDVGIFLCYYPFDAYRFFMSLSLAQFGIVSGQTMLEKNFYGLNEVCLGYSFIFSKGLLLEPALVIRDPSGTFSEEYDMIRGSFPCNRTFRFRLNIGWSFDIQKKNKRSNYVF